MSSALRDFSVLDRFHLERKPVGIKYLPTRPENIIGETAWPKRNAKRRRKNP